MERSTRSIALFLDCENISADHIVEIYQKLSAYGQIVVSRAYANWSRDKHSAWRGACVAHTIELIHPITAMKNAADIRITIDVMKVMEMPQIEIIALVSSDSDFTGLAIEGQSRGITMIGIGEKHAPQMLRHAYAEFIILSEKKKQQPNNPRAMPTSVIPHINHFSSKEMRAFVLKELHIAIAYLQTKNKQKQKKRLKGTVHLSRIASYFDERLLLTAKDMGFSKWKHVIAAYPKEFQIKKDHKDHYIGLVKRKKR